MSCKLPCHINIASCARDLPNYAKIVMSMGLARGGGFLFSYRHVVGLIMSKLGIGSNLAR